MNTSPQMMIALLRQLVYDVGADPADISIGDTLCYFPKEYYDMCNHEFPDVRYLDYEGKFGRTRVRPSAVPLFWSNHPSVSQQDHVPASFDAADCLINMANLKSHSSAGVTLCGKNHYGSLVRYPDQTGYYDVHQDLPSNRNEMGSYRNLVDLMGHAHIGGKTLLYFIDGLYAGHHPFDDAPTRLNAAPFNGDWSSSLFVSQDPVAIDSVAFDILRAEPGWQDPRIPGTDDYLHEAAQAGNPPSGTFYDPNNGGDVARLGSLGVHEHWNNPTEKRYSRNLGTGPGIELMKLTGPYQACVIDQCRPRKCKPGRVVRIVGKGFGKPGKGKKVHIGARQYGSRSSRITAWRNTRIRVKTSNYNCKWFGGKNYKKQKVWVTLDGIDSHRKTIMIREPNRCK
jgi:hypothetical protein